MIRRKSAFKNLHEISEESGIPVMDPAFVPKILYGHRSSLESLSHLELACESKVLVLYTGGTIGMVVNENGKLAPIPHALENRIRLFPHMHDAKYAKEKFAGIVNPPLILPETKEKSRIAYWVYEYNPLLDSSNMTMDDWIRIAKDIKRVYEHFDAFVILHGTDTLAYTASALSFMMENLGKPIIITGSQIPLFETRSDGRDNFIGSLIIAGHHEVPEITIFFNNKLYRGNRTVKVSSGSLDAFNSPNLQPLAVAGISINVDEKLIFRTKALAKFNVHPKLSRQVGLLRIFPSISQDVLRSFLLPPTRGAVLQTYGSGNIPCNRQDLIDILCEASERGIIIVNITQCAHGSVQAIYETSDALKVAGVIPGYDMTPEAALTKLAYVLSKEEWDLPTKKTMVMQNIRGELTEIKENNCDQTPLGILNAVNRALQISTTSEAEHIEMFLLPTLFFSAVSNADMVKMESIIAHLPNINCKDYGGWTALHIACHEGSVEAVKWLLQKGASVHVKNMDGHTPLWKAVQNCHMEVIYLMRQTGAHLSSDIAALSECVIRASAHGNIKLLKALHAAGCDMNITDSTGRTGMHSACITGMQETVQFLLACQVDLDIKDMMGFTPKYLADSNNFAVIANVLNEYQIKRGKPENEHVGRSFVPQVFISGE